VREREIRRHPRRLAEGRTRCPDAHHRSQRQGERQLVAGGSGQEIVLAEPGANGVPDGDGVHHDAETHVLRRVERPAALVEVGLAVPYEIVERGHRRPAGGDPPEVKGAALQHPLHHLVVELDELPRAEDAVALPPLAMKIDQDLLPPREVLLRGDPLHHGLVARPFLEGTERASNQVPPARGERFQIGLPRAGQGDVRRRGRELGLHHHPTLLQRRAQDERHGGVGVHRLEHQLVEGTELSVRERARERPRHRLLHRALREEPHVLGADLVLFRLTATEQLEAPERKSQLVREAPGEERHEADQTRAVLHRENAELPAVLPAEHAPPRQEPRGREHGLVGGALREERLPGRDERRQGREIGDDIEREGHRVGLAPGRRKKRGNPL
jgi:hypothetical protein